MDTTNQPMTYKGMMGQSTPQAPQSESSSSVAALHGVHQANIEALVHGLNEIFTKMFHGGQAPGDAAVGDPVSELGNHLTKYQQLLSILNQEKAKK